MRKKNSQEKGSLFTAKDKPCRYCLPYSTPSHILSHNLRKKYQQPQVQNYHFRTITNLLYDPHSLENIQLNEVRKEMQESESLGKCYNFEEITQTIRGVIICRVGKDFYGWVDFQPPHFLITNTYYLKRKQLVQNSRMLEKHLKNTSDLQSTGSGDDHHARQYMRSRIKKQLDQQRIVKPDSETTSTLELKKLAKNIELMVEKIADLSTIHGLPKVNPINQQAEPAEPLQLLRVSSEEISAIRKSEEFLTIKEPNTYHQSYGLDAIKPKHNKKKKFHKLGLRSIDQIRASEETRLPPLTPSSKTIHRLDYTEHQDFPKRDKSRSNHILPLSPCSHSSSVSSQKSKTTSRSKSRSRRR